MPDIYDLGFPEAIDGIEYRHVMNADDSKDVLNA
jgi:hypothetical protein